ncbi:uncharacterized protein K02A2.6-like [Metopolophium dirhodum]|uniref:uncharacterized protein K02A2.6-like n=1 Tax=Metopolophium dirhodum TaxID=44670 RepID=UPI00298F6617|nr:uncharacterized protein K02A2.6-like [Metopolophium dirhodum]
MSRSNINSATTQASSGSGRGNGNISKGQINGTISEFNLKVDDFSSWIERFELYVLLNEINSHKKKLMFLTLLGNDGYVLVRDLCTPFKPVDKSYDTLKEMLSNYINPKPNVLTERYKFKERKQGSEETISQFVTALKKLSQYCEFGNNLDDSLRDQVVYGIRDNNIKKRLMSEPELTFRKSVTLCLSMEAANNDVSHWEKQELNYQRGMKFKQNRQPWGQGKSRKAHRSDSMPNNQKDSTNNSSHGRKTVCFCCGKAGHTKPFCKYKHLTCTKCSKVGHLLKVCKAKSKAETVDVNFIKPFNIKLDVSGIIINFQIDTGSSITALSYSDACRVNLKLKDIQKSDISLKGYTGTLIIPMGYLKVSVKFHGKIEVLNLYIIKEGGPPIVGRDWIENLSLPIKGEVYSLSSKTERNIFEDFPSVFGDVLGCYKPKVFKLFLKDENIKPIFCKPRVLPFALKDKVSLEIDRLVSEKLLIPLESSEWATPVVPVLKSDGKIRLCGDYKVTLNKCIKIDRYPIPRVGDLMAILQGASKFCVLDLCQAYQQLSLDEESQKLTTLSTHKGLFVFKRIPYGIASAPGILQREMENILRNIEGTVAFYDDIIISGKSKEEVTKRLREVLERLGSVGLTVRKDKCKLFQDSVTFLGYKIDKDGLHVPEARVIAITSVPIPCSVTQLKAFLGLLLKKDIPFVWGKDQNKAFNEIKSAILSNEILIHYNPKWPIIIACDASPTGIEAVLSHKLPDGTEKPIAFTSRTLNKAERAYAQIDKEALAIVNSVKYFHQYVYGREFILRTDHKPLVVIFGPKKGIPVMIANRLQRYAIFLSGYNYEIQFVKGIDNGNADALSRLPLDTTASSNILESDNYSINLITENIKAISDLDICEEIKKDTIIKQVFFSVFTGQWPTDIKKVSEELKPYFNRKDQFSIEQGLLFWGHRLVIPSKFRTELLTELHSTHLGVIKMKSIARSFIWWPGIDLEIEGITKRCELCLIHSENPPKAVLHSWPWPDGPSLRVHLDFLGPVNKRMFLVIIDAFSKWVYVKFMPNITTFSTIKILREYFAYWGIPAKLVTDNGPSLCSKEMEDFLQKNRVFHIKTSPYNPASNGAAENLVRTFKNFIKKCNPNSDIEVDVYRFVMSYNSIKHCSTGVTPAELHIGRTLPTQFDRLIPFAKNKYNKCLENAKHVFRGNREKSYKIGDTVMCRNYGSGNIWVPGTIIKVLSPITYLVQINNSLVWKRHINQIIDRVKNINVNHKHLNDIETRFSENKPVIESIIEEGGKVSIEVEKTKSDVIEVKP